MEYYKKKAKRFFKDYKQGCPIAKELAALQYPRKACITLMNAQHIIAVTEGFKDWEDLRRSV